MGFTIEEKLEAILLWVDQNRNYEFDTTFIDSMQDRISKGEELTRGQLNAIDTILAKWDIEPSDWI